MKRSPIKRKRSGRRTANRDHGDMGNAWATVWVRQGGECLLCGLPMTDAHHRQTKRFGPDCPANLIGLCSWCHHNAVHNRPAFSLARGLIVSRHAADPCSHPIYLDGQWWGLSCAGGRQKLSDETSPESVDHTFRHG